MSGLQSVRGFDVHIINFIIAAVNVHDNQFAVKISSILSHFEQILTRKSSDNCPFDPDLPDKGLFFRKKGTGVSLTEVDFVA